MSYIIPTILAFCLHGALLLLLMPYWFQQEDPYQKVPRHIKAQMIDLDALTHQTVVPKPTQKAATAEPKRASLAQAENERLIAEKKAQAAQQRAVQRQREQEAARQEALKRQIQEAERKKVAEARRRAQLKAAEKAAKAKAEADKKRQAQEAQRQKAQAEKVKKQAEEKKKRLAAEKKRQEKAQRQAAKAAEQKRLAEAAKQAEAARQAAQQQAAADRKAAEMRASVIGYMQSLLQRKWRRPSSARKGMMTLLQVHLFPSGEVDEVVVISSSGDASFDKSARQAVLRVGRFPKIADVDPIFFERELRRIKIKFRPEDARW